MTAQNELWTIRPWEELLRDDQQPSDHLHDVTAFASQVRPKRPAAADINAVEVLDEHSTAYYDILNVPNERDPRHLEWLAVTGTGQCDRVQSYLTIRRVTATPVTPGLMGLLADKQRQRI